MSVNTTDNLSLLASLLSRGTAGAAAPSSAPAGPTDSHFAERLARELDGAAPSAGVRPQAVAEALSLHMLQATLSLVDGGNESPQRLFAPQSAGFQALARAYAANLPAAENSAATPSQLQEIEPFPTVPQTQIQTQFPTTVPSGGNQHFDDIISRAASRYGVDAGLIKAVIKAESGFNPTAVSHAGARGLMQLMPATARSLGVSDSFDPEQNIMAGTRFLRDLLKRYNGDIDSALAAYNWGPGNVDKGTGRLPRETRDYLARVKQFYNSFA